MPHPEDDLFSEIFQDSTTGADEGGQDSTRTPQPEEPILQRMRWRMRALASLLGVIFVLAALGIFINLVQLSRSVLPDFSLEVNGPDALESARYRARLRWTEGGSSATGAAPAVALGGHVLPAGISNGAEISLGRPEKLQLLIDGNTATGHHRGEIILTRSSGPDDAPAVLAIPVEIQVFGGVWSRSWQTARWWLVGIAFLLAAFYFICVLIVPRPRGSLWVGAEGEARTPALVKLKPTLAGWFQPWRRNWVPLSSISKWSGVKPLSRIGGGLFFVESRWPRLEIPARRSGRVVETAEAQGAGIREYEGRPFRTVSDHISISESQVYRVRSVSGSPGVRIRYSGSRI